jgi:hypothetical protein
MIARKPAYAVSKAIMGKSAIRRGPAPHVTGRILSSSETIALERKRPAAIRQLGATGKVPVMTDKDARHPNSKNHGRIAGR